MAKRSFTKRADSTPKPGLLRRRHKSWPLVYVALALVALLFTASPVLAAEPDAPASMGIDDVLVVHNLLEDDDFLLVYKYEVGLGPESSGPVNELFHFRLFDTDGTTLLSSSEPYPYYDSGYGEGITGIYFSAIDAPTYSSALKINISSNPLWYSTIIETNYVLLASDYSALDDSEDNSELMTNHIIEIFRDLELAWELSMVIETDVGPVLDSVGETYVRGSIPGIGLTCPRLFGLVESLPEYETTEWETSLFDTYALRWDGTMIGDFLSQVESLFGMKWNFITGAGIFGAVMVGFAVSFHFFRTTAPAMVAGACFIVGGSVMGFVAFPILAILTIGYSLFTGYILIFRHA